MCHFVGYPVSVYKVGEDRNRDGKSAVVGKVDQTAPMEKGGEN